MILEDDGDPGADPVCHHRQEVLEDGEELVAAGDGEDELWCSGQHCYAGR
jgi:hypothetical protein